VWALTVTSAIVARRSDTGGEVSVRPDRNYVEPLNSGEVFWVGREDQ